MFKSVANHRAIGDFSGENGDSALWRRLARAVEV